MKSCSKCGSTLSEDDGFCPNCGAATGPVDAEPELVEGLTIEAITISERGFSFRIKNTGTAPFTVDRVLFAERPATITNVSSDTGVVKDGLLTLQPGDGGQVTFHTSYPGTSGIAYPAAIITQSGRRYDTSIGYP